MRRIPGRAIIILRADHIRARASLKSEATVFSSWMDQSLEICFLITSVENRVIVEVQKEDNQKYHQWLVEISNQTPTIFLCRQILDPGQVKVA